MTPAHQRCPSCDAVLRLSTTRCPGCQMWLVDEPVVPDEPVEVPHKRKRRRKKQYVSETTGRR